MGSFDPFCSLSVRRALPVTFLGGAGAEPLDGLFWFFLVGDLDFRAWPGVEATFQLRVLFDSELDRECLMIFGFEAVCEVGGGL